MRSADSSTWCRITAGALLSLALALAFAGQAEAVGLLGLTADGREIVHFDSATPGTIVRGAAVTGLQPGERLAGIDVRPATGQLYGVGIVTGATDTGRLYLIDPVTGIATQVGTTPFATDLLTAAAYGVDFNPVPDRVRIVNVAGDNLRVNPNNGALAGNDTDLTPGPPDVTAVAYDRSTAGTTVTTLFGIDTTTDQLVRIGGVDGTPTPNGGVVTPVGPLGVDAIGDAGFDIDPAGTLFAALTVGGQNGLYALDPATGTATLVGPIGNGSLGITGLAAASNLALTISPPSGLYATNQAFDLQLFVEADGRTIQGGTLTFDGIDVGAALAACLVPGTQVPGGGLTLRCPGLSGALLGVGTHTLSATLTFSGGGANGASATSSVTWTVVQTTEP
jgi:Domain of unknown function (DUF4394)